MRKPGLHNLVGMQLKMLRENAWMAGHSLAVVDELHQMGVISYPRTESTGVDLHSLQQARDSIAMLQSAGHAVPEGADASVLLVNDPPLPGVTFYDIPGIMPTRDLPPQDADGDDRRKAYDEIVAQFMHAVTPAPCRPRHAG